MTKTCRKGLHRYDPADNPPSHRGCPECRRTSRAVHDQTDKGKARYARYTQTDKGKARHARYNQGEKGLARSARHSQTPKGKARDHRYNTSEKGKASKARHNCKRAVEAIRGQAAGPRSAGLQVTTRLGPAVAEINGQ
jgi:hypothetical protein